MVGTIGEGNTVPVYIPEISQQSILAASRSNNKSDQRFLSQLLDGYKWQAYVLSAIQSHGYWGCIHPLRVRPTRSVAASFSDSYDIRVGSPPNSDKPWSIEIEVKARTRSFTTPKSFPFPTIIIEPSSRFVKREVDEHPDWYCVVSQYNYSMVFLKSKEEYAVEEKQGREYITAPKEEWLSLDQFLAELPEASLTLPA